MRIIKWGSGKNPTRMTCEDCLTEIEIAESDWKEGTYGSERVVKCPGCSRTLVKPNTEYTGDF